MPDPSTPITVERAHTLFHPRGIHLNIATAGLPPDPSWEALQRTWSAFRDGTADAIGYDDDVARARADYARLVGCPVEQVAIGNQASPFVGLIAASLPAGSTVLLAEGDFTSVVFPFLAQPGLRVQQVPLAELPEAITQETTLVAVSAVQSADGAIADLPAIREACRAAGALSLIDTTQAAGWMSYRATDFDITVTSGYKWLLAPRGTAFMTIRPELMDQVIPAAANWYAGEDRWASIYGGPLRLATDARRYDISPAWHSWVGAAPSLKLLADLGSAAIHAYDVGLANRFCAALELPSTSSAIVSVEVTEEAAAIVAEHRIACAMRAGRLRLSFHLSNSEADVDAAAAALRPAIRRRF